jgi:glucuronoarabinoxylan endo-1,4-beta-xylanase
VLNVRYVAFALVFAACVGVPPRPPSMAVVLEQDSERSRSAPFVESLEEGPVTRARVEVLLGERHQVLEGFGAAVAWHIDRMLGVTPEGLYEFLFPELGLDILRFRNRFDRSDASDGRLAQEQEIMRRATEALGRKPKLLLSSWSPPARLKASGVERCKNGVDCTLKKQNGRFMYQEFAEYWLSSVEHYRSLDLAPDYVSIQNEPDFIPPDWEGCKFEPTESADYPGYGTALAAVHAKFAQLRSRPKLLGPEVLGVHYQRVQKYMAGLDATLLDGVAHHIYEKGEDPMWDWREPGPDSFIDELSAVGALTDKPLYQTEFSTNEDRGVDGGFETAWLVHHSLVHEGTAAFLYWDLVWDGAAGLVGMVGREAKPRDQYYAIRHFARYTDPGHMRVATRSSEATLLASGYVSPDERRLTVVVLNTSARSADIEFEPGFAAVKSAVYRTSFRPGRSRRWEELGAVKGALRMPARSVATVVFDR